MNKKISYAGIFIILLVSITLHCSWKPDAKDLIGTWRGKFNNIAFTIAFEDKHNYVMNLFGRKQAGEYEVDFSKNPIQLFITNSGGIKESCIIEFIDEDHIRFQNSGPNAPPPEKFADERVILMRRIE